MPSKLAALNQWVDDVARQTQPDHIHWCDGSEAEKDALTADAVAQGVLIKLNQEKLPGCYYHRSNPNDVAREFSRMAANAKAEANSG